MWESADTVVFWLTLAYAVIVAADMVVQSLLGTGGAIVVPNWVPLLAVIGLLVKLAVLNVPAATAIQHLGIGIGLLGLSFLMFAGGMISSGFGKLISAALAFLGPAYFAETFGLVAAITVLGGLTGSLILKAKGRAGG